VVRQHHQVTHPPRLHLAQLHQHRQLHHNILQHHHPTAQVVLLLEVEHDNHPLPQATRRHHLHIRHLALATARLREALHLVEPKLLSTLQLVQLSLLILLSLPRRMTTRIIKSMYYHDHQTHA